MVKKKVDGRALRALVVAGLDLPLLTHFTQTPCDVEKNSSVTLLKLSVMSPEYSIQT